MVRGFGGKRRYEKENPKKDAPYLRTSRHLQDKD
jgi:hypothetical protein